MFASHSYLVLNDIDSAMVVITGAVANSGGGGSQTSMHDSASATRINGQNGADANEPGSLRLEPTTHPLAMPWLNRNAMANGPMDEIVSLNDMLDSCIMYYYAVAHKYIVMVSQRERERELLRIGGDIQSQPISFSISTDCRFAG